MEDKEARCNFGTYEPEGTRELRCWRTKLFVPKALAVLRSLEATNGFFSTDLSFTEDRYTRCWVRSARTIRCEEAVEGVEPSVWSCFHHMM
jgi:hypothetical protein